MSVLTEMASANMRLASLDKRLKTIETLTLVIIAGLVCLIMLT